MKHRQNPHWSSCHSGSSDLVIHEADLRRFKGRGSDRCAAGQVRRSAVMCRAHGFAENISKFFWMFAAHCCTYMYANVLCRSM